MIIHLIWKISKCRSQFQRIMHRCALTFHYVTILRLSLAHSYSPLWNVCWTSLPLPFSLILLPSCHHLPLASPSIPLILTHCFSTSASSALIVTSFFLHTSPHLSLFAHILSSPPLSPVPSLAQFLSVPLYSFGPVYSYSYSPLPHFFIFHPFISLSFPTLSPFHLSSPSFSFIQVMNHF